ncbi:type VI secretion system baseplate subunit TssE, partial [Burkholderia pseudomallei]
MNDDVRAAGGVRAAHDRLQPALLDRLTDAERERRT